MNSDDEDDSGVDSSTPAEFSSGGHTRYPNLKALQSKLSKVLVQVCQTHQLTDNCLDVEVADQKTPASSAAAPATTPATTESLQVCDYVNRFAEMGHPSQLSIIILEEEKATSISMLPAVLNFTALLLRPQFPLKSFTLHECYYHSGDRPVPSYCAAFCSSQVSFFQALFLAYKTRPLEHVEIICGEHVAVGSRNIYQPIAMALTYQKELRHVQLGNLGLGGARTIALCSWISRQSSLRSFELVSYSSLEVLLISCRFNWKKSRMFAGLQKLVLSPMPGSGPTLDTYNDLRRFTKNCETLIRKAIWLSQIIFQIHPNTPSLDSILNVLDNSEQIMDLQLNCKEHQMVQNQINAKTAVNKQRFILLQSLNSWCMTFLQAPPIYRLILTYLYPALDLYSCPVSLISLPGM